MQYKEYNWVDRHRLRTYIRMKKNVKIIATTNKEITGINSYILSSLIMLIHKIKVAVSNVYIDDSVLTWPT